MGKYESNYKLKKIKENPLILKDINYEYNLGFSRLKNIFFRFEPCEFSKINDNNKEAIYDTINNYFYYLEKEIILNRYDIKELRNDGTISDNWIEYNRNYYREGENNKVINLSLRYSKNTGNFEYLYLENYIREFEKEETIEDTFEFVTKNLKNLDIECKDKVEEIDKLINLGKNKQPISLEKIISNS
jgi:hypothetical protein